MLTRHVVRAVLCAFHHMGMGSDSDLMKAVNDISVDVENHPSDSPRLLHADVKAALIEGHITASYVQQVDGKAAHAAWNKLRKWFTAAFGAFEASGQQNPHVDVFASCLDNKAKDANRLGTLYAFACWFNPACPAGGGIGQIPTWVTRQLPQDVGGESGAPLPPLAASKAAFDRVNQTNATKRQKGTTHNGAGDNSSIAREVGAQVSAGLNVLGGALAQALGPQHSAGGAREPELANASEHAQLKLIRDLAQTMQEVTTFAKSVGSAPESENRAARMTGQLLDAVERMLPRLNAPPQAPMVQQPVPLPGMGAAVNRAFGQRQRGSGGGTGVGDIGPGDADEQTEEYRGRRPSDDTQDWPYDAPEQPEF